MGDRRPRHRDEPRRATRTRSSPTGEIEVHGVELTVFNKSETPPFEIADEIDTGEEKRLEYRYLDLRRAPLQKTLRVRHRINQATRSYFDEQGFLELETPFLVKYTPGGARNFLVPSPHARRASSTRSPRARSSSSSSSWWPGFDRYFQIVKCFRDEDLRVDRQPEFTQIDVEMSLRQPGRHLPTSSKGWSSRSGRTCSASICTRLYPSGRFPQMPFDESMGKYGNDKPDLRFGMPHTDLTELVIEHGGGGVPFWKDIAEKFASGEYRRDLPDRDRQGDARPGRAARSSRAPRSTSSRSS